MLAIIIRAVISYSIVIETYPLGESFSAYSCEVDKSETGYDHVGSMSIVDTFGKGSA